MGETMTFGAALKEGLCDKLSLPERIFRPLVFFSFIWCMYDPSIGPKERVFNGLVLAMLCFRYGTAYAGARHDKA